MKKLTYLLVITLISVVSYAQQGNKNCIGIWKNEKGEFELKGDGTSVFGEHKATYTYANGMMTFDFGGGVILTYKVTINGNTMTSEGYGQYEVYQRATGKSSSSTGGNRKSNSGGREIAGTWCQVSSGTTNISYMNCYVLGADGRYEYTTEGSISSSNGGVSHNGSDYGTWSYDGTTLRLQSQMNGVVQYNCTKSHKNRDVALNLDGTLFVTYYQHSDW